MAKLNNCKNFWISCMRFGRFFGCHQRPERSFFYKNMQFPVCARCTGVIIGQFLAIIFFLLQIRLNFLISILFCAIMFGDWLLQKLNILPSTNIRRLITGLLGGYGYITFWCWIIFFIIYLF